MKTFAKWISSIFRMSNSSLSEQKSSDNNDFLEQAKYLWGEYKYRHDLIWQLIFRFTTAVVLISTIPYIKVEIVACVGYFIVFVPILATILACFGILVMVNELELFGKIKNEYRELQNGLFQKKRKIFA